MRKAYIYPVIVLLLSAGFAWAASLEEKAVKDLTNRDAARRRDAAESLAEYKYEPAVPALAQALKDKDESVRAASTYALWNIGDASASAMPDLKAALSDDSGLVRIYAAGALEMLGESPKILIPAVQEALLDSRLWVRAYAIENLLGWKISIKTLLPEIRSVFSSTPAGAQREQTSYGFFAGFLDTENTDPNTAAKELLAKALGEYPQPPEMAAVWKMALEDPAENIRGYAMEELAGMKPIAPEVLTRIREYAKSRSDSDRMSAYHALGSLEPIPAEVVADLSGGMNDKQEMVRSTVAKALAHVKPVTKQVVDALILGLRDKKSDVRRAAADALEEIGPAGKDAIPALKEVAASDKEWTVQGSAKSALHAMGEKVDWN
jgi:HEAT repeat protein